MVWHFPISDKILNRPLLCMVTLPLNSSPLIMSAQDPPPRLCAIYLRDVLTFLIRREIQECRRVSTNIDDTFNRHSEGKWPRYRLTRLGIMTVRVVKTHCPSPSHPLSFAFRA